MKRIIGGMLLVSFAAYGMTAGRLDDESVLRLVRSGVSEDVVVRIIQSQPGDYTLTAESFSALRKSGASDRVIAALITHPTQRKSAPVESPADVSAVQLLANTEPNTAITSSINETAVIPVPKSDSSLIVRDGTPLRLRLNRTLSSEDEQVGQKVDFDVMDDLRSGDQILIPRGTKAIGAITEAERKKRMARGGKLNFVMEYIILKDGTKVALRASKESVGGGHAGAMTAGIVAATFVAWPAAPLFLMMHGKSAVIPEATEITAYVDGEVHIPASDSLLSRR